MGAFQGEAASVAHSRGGFSRVGVLLWLDWIKRQDLLSRNLQGIDKFPQRRCPRLLFPRLDRMDGVELHAAEGAESTQREQAPLSPMFQLPTVHPNHLAS